MRRGAVVIIVVGILIVGGGLAAFLILTASGGQNGFSITAPPTPTASPEPTVRVVVARFEIEAGTVITSTEDFLTTEDVPISDIGEQDDFFRNPADVEGKLAVVSIGRNERIRRSDVTDPGLSQRIPEADEDEIARPKAYPLLVNALTGVADQIKPGDLVDVVITFDVSTRTASAQAAPDAEGFQRYSIEFEQFRTTKTLVQRAEILNILRPARPQAEGQEGEGGAPPPGQDIPQEGQPPPQDEQGRAIAQGQEGVPGEVESITGGSWVVVMAINDQEAEIIELARANDARITLVLRSADDQELEETVGATIDLLVSDFGLPQPEPLLPPAVVEIP